MANPAEHESSRKVQASSAIARMEGSAGEFSYTRNSSLQAHAVDILKPILKQEISALLKLDSWQGTVRIADFGCSVGANTLGYAEICFQIVQERCRARSNDGREALDVQYFSDLPSNDFNTLFQQLEWRSPCSDPAGVVEDGERERFYAAAVPGSFYERLFPAGSLHVAISTFGLMWMSKVPDAVRDNASPAYKGRVSVAGVENAAALEAFVRTARQDLRNFLLSRAEEVVSGGLVFLYLVARAGERHPENQYPKGGECGFPHGLVFEETWEELVVEGVIKEEERDSFNLPFYIHSLDEVREAAEFTNAYDIKQLEYKHRTLLEPDAQEKLLADPEAFGRFMKNLLRSTVHSYVVAHFGEKNANEFFERLEQNEATALRERRITSLPMDLLLAVFVRK